MASKIVVGSKRPRAADSDSDAVRATPAAEGSTQSSTVYLEGLPYTASEDDIRTFFEGCGDITDIRAPRYHDSGRLRGYAHVDFSSKAAAARALTKDGAYLGGRFIAVAAAKEVGAGRDSSMAFSSRPRPGGCTTLFVKSLPYETDEESVKAAFAPFGNVTSVRLARWNHTSRLKGFGYVQYEHGYSAEAAMKAFRAHASKSDPTSEGIVVGGRHISLDYETAAPRQGFKTEEGVNFFKTDEAEVVKKQSTKISRRDEKKASGSGPVSSGKEASKSKRSRTEEADEDEEASD